MASRSTQLKAYDLIGDSDETIIAIILLLISIILIACLNKLVLKTDPLSYIKALIALTFKGVLRGMFNLTNVISEFTMVIGDMMIDDTITGEMMYRNQPTFSQSLEDITEELIYIRN